MPYTINKFNNEPLVVLEDGTIDTTTSLGLVGRNYVGYGETQNENFLWLLENFANDAPPSRPLPGQTWFNTTAGVNSLNVYTGTAWSPVGNASVSKTAPDNPSAGQLWVDSDTNQLSIYLNDNWQFVGPEGVAGFGVTRARSGTLVDASLVTHPVTFLTVNDINVGVISATSFTIDPGHGILGFSNIVAGLTLSSAMVVKGNLTGNASSASSLLNTRLINNVPFDGTADVTIKATTTHKLIKGAYLTGRDFDGSTEETFAVDASSANVSGKVVARNASGGFAAGIITADLAGNVTTTTGTSTFNIVQANEFIGAVLTGNSATTTKLKTARKINDVLFDGTADVTVPANAETLTGAYLNPTVTQSALTRLGTLSTLNVADAGIVIGSSNLHLYTDSGNGIRSQLELSINIKDDDNAGGYADLRFMPAQRSLALSGDNLATIAPNITETINLGHTNKLFDKVYANDFIGNASSATTAVTATNIAGGAAGSIPYQTASGTTELLPAGTPGYVLKAGSGGSISWDALALERLTAGDYIKYTGTGTPTYYNTMLPLTINVDATTANTAGKIVARDSSGNFSAGTITAELDGNAATATKFATSRKINNVDFDGTADITIQANDPTKLALAGGTMTGFLTLSGTPTSAMHATTKQYVDTRIPVYTFTTGNTEYTYGYTNTVGSWNNSYNWVDVYPPAGKTMANLQAFIPSIAVIHYAGGVNGDDSMRCTWANLGDRIRIWVQNTEQRSTPAANWLAVWS